MSPMFVVTAPGRMRLELKASLPSMADLDELAHELDAVDSVLAELDQTPA